MNTHIVTNDVINNELQGETVRDNPDENVALRKHRKWRNLIGFWFLGVCNNYAYVIMLSAAFDLLNKGKSKTKCNAVSTGAILLADIIPSLAIKLITPFLNISINVRVTTAIFLSGASFLLTAFSINSWMIFIGVICAALSSGLGEVTILSLTSYFHKDVVSTWSSGTGGAGVIGAISYAVLSEHLGTDVTLQVMLIIPAIMAVMYWIVIERTSATQVRCKVLSCSDSELEPFMNQSSSFELSAEGAAQKRPQKYSIKQKIALIKPLLKYMIPLGVVYFAEYFINQGLMELLNFKNNVFNWDQEYEYHWYQVCYQIGVCVSRSSVNCVRINRLWILPILQIFNLVFLLLQVYFQFLPSIIIVIFIILYEGLLGGLAYVNTFYKISEEIPEEHREFSMGVTSISDASGITLAGAIAIPVHDAFCRVLK